MHVTGTAAQLGVGETMGLGGGIVKVVVLLRSQDDIGPKKLRSSLCSKEVKLDHAD